MKKAGIVGAGLLGRLLALKLLEHGWCVSLFDQDKSTGHLSCGYIAGGMLSPFVEIETSDSTILQLGLRSLEIWPQIISKLLENINYKITGSIIVAHTLDLAEIERFINILSQKLNPVLFKNVVKIINKSHIQNLEPELEFSHGIYIKNEGYIDNRQLFKSLYKTLIANGVDWHEQTKINETIPYNINTQNNSYKFDMVFDCRGIGAKNNLPNLRGVRGEILTVHAPDVNFTHPIRIMHPRHRIYIVPRPQNHFVIGATEIESYDMSNISLKSTLELLSAAYTVHKGFAEARIIDSFVNCRPAFNDNLPQIKFTDGLIHINGLYRHGYLIAPAIIEKVLILLNNL